MENNKELYSKVAILETKVDLLETELHYLNTILVRCGFPKGIDSLKATVEEILVENPDMIEDDHQEMI